MRAKELPPIELLREKFSYNPETGEIFSKMRQRVVGVKQFQRGKPSHIMVRYYIPGGWQEFQNLAAHRLAFALMGVEVPEGMMIDHKDVDPFNNRWNNLRLATNQQNKRNGEKYRPKDFIGPLLPKGVTVFHIGGGSTKFRAMLHRGDRVVSLGLFDTPDAAAEAFRAAAAESHGEFVRF